MGWIKPLQIHQLKQDSSENGSLLWGWLSVRERPLLLRYCRNIFRNWKRGFHTVFRHIIEILEDWPASGSEKWQGSIKSFPAIGVTSVGWRTSDATPTECLAKSEESEFRKCGELPTCIGQVSSRPHNSRKIEDLFAVCCMTKHYAHSKDETWFEHLLRIFYNEDYLGKPRFHQQGHSWVLLWVKLNLGEEREEGNTSCYDKTMSGLVSPVRNWRIKVNTGMTRFPQPNTEFSKDRMPGLPSFGQKFLHTKNVT